MPTVENPPTRVVDGKFSYYDGESFKGVGAEHRWVGGGDFVTNAGSGAAGVAGGAPGWLLDAASDESVIASVQLPSGWTAFTATVYWSNASTGAGAVVWDVNVSSLAAGAAPGVGTTNSVTATASTTQHLVVASAVATAFSVTDSVPFRLRVNRDSDNGADTVANDANFLGVLLTRVMD